MYTENVNGNLLSKTSGRRSRSWCLVRIGEECYLHILVMNRVVQECWICCKKSIAMRSLEKCLLWTKMLSSESLPLSKHGSMNMTTKLTGNHQNGASQVSQKTTKQLIQNQSFVNGFLKCCGVHSKLSASNQTENEDYVSIFKPLGEKVSYKRLGLWRNLFVESFLRLLRR